MDIQLETYDAGYLNDYGGGNIEWWHWYIRYLLASAYDHYQDQVDNSIERVNEPISERRD